MSTKKLIKKITKKKIHLENIENNHHALVSIDTLLDHHQNLQKHQTELHEQTIDNENLKKKLINKDVKFCI